MSNFLFSYFTLMAMSCDFSQIFMFLTEKIEREKNRICSFSSRQVEFPKEMITFSAENSLMWNNYLRNSSLSRGTQRSIRVNSILGPLPASYEKFPEQNSSNYFCKKINFNVELNTAYLLMNFAYLYKPS